MTVLLAMFLSATSVTAAVAHEGSSLAEDRQSLSGPVEIDGLWLASLLFTDGSEGRILDVHFDAIRVTVYERPFLEAHGVDASVRQFQENFSFGPGMVQAQGHKPGLLGIIPASRTMASIKHESPSLERRERGHLGSNGTRESIPDNAPAFGMTIDEPHSLIKGGVLNGTSLWRMKVYGPRVIVESEGDVVVFTTGREYERVGRALTAGRDVWLVIEAEGRVVVRSHAALTTALSNPWISWSPEIAAAEPHVVVAERPDFLLPGLTILAVAFAGAVALHARFTRDREPSGRVPTSSLTPETCLAEASHAATAGQWGRALEWTQRSRRLAPKSARLALDEAFALKQLGDVDGAIEAYGEAAALGDDGVAEFSAARLAAFADRPAVVVAIWLERAVARDPGFADEARLDPDLARYAGDPRVARIIGSG